MEEGNGRNDEINGKNNKFREPMGMGNPLQIFLNPRMLPLVVCLLPIVILALYIISTPGQHDPQIMVSNPSAALPQKESDRIRNKIGFNIRNVLDRVDVMGYGTTHPRVAFVVVGEDRNTLIQSIESIFSSTDMRRIFVICAVLEGHANDAKLLKKLHKIEKGSVPHWHGLKNEVHLKGGDTKNLGDDNDNDEKEDEDNFHSPKIHVLFNPAPIGLAASRSRATDFIQILVNKHENSGIKSPDEDLILLLLQGGSKFNDPKWLQEVTPALIIPPPLLGHRNEDVPLKLSNAISFHIEGTGKRTSFDKHLMPITTDATATDINQSSGRSFRTPAFNGAGIAMRLETFQNLPSQNLPNLLIPDQYLMDNWSANLDLALSLWLCADGIDIIDDLQVMPPSEEIYTNTPMLHEQVARFASLYMDDVFRQKFFRAAYSTKTGLDWETEVANIRRNLSSKTQNLFRRCRSFKWYIKEVNTDLSDVLEENILEDRHFDAHNIEDSPAKKISSTANNDNDNTGKKQIDSPKEEVEKEEMHIAPPKIEEETSEKVDVRKKPSKPLSPFNLEIVQKPEMVDISFVDVSDGHQEHPHLGATDSNLVSGFVHDETALRKNPPPFTFDEVEMKKGCLNHDSNYHMMNERIVVETDYDKKMESSEQKRDKIFCLVYTIESGHSKIPFIRETWGSKCDGFMVGSNKTDVSIGAVNIPHEGPEEYNNIWQKVRSMWSYIYDNYFESYDWFHIGGDDLFLIVENLRYYLESEEIRTASNGGIFLPDGNTSKQTPLFLGRRFAYQGSMDDIFNSGGSGYTMNKAALKLVVTELFPNYFPHRKTFSEDTMMAKLFQKMNVLPYDTKDDDGGERYMPFLPGHHYTYKLPSKPNKDWYAKYSINIKEGPAHCSPQSVAFHYVKGNMMKRLFALAYGLCPKT